MIGKAVKEKPPESQQFIRRLTHHHPIHAHGLSILIPSNVSLPLYVTQMQNYLSYVYVRCKGYFLVSTCRCVSLV
jgi:hypothetical protein